MENPLNPYAAPSTTDSYLPSQPTCVPHESLRQVATGLGLVRLSVIIMFLAFVVYFITAMFLVRGLVAQGGAAQAGVARGAVPQQLQLVLVAFGAVVIAAKLLGLFGKYRCITVPEDSNARSLAIASFSIDLLTLAIGIVNRFLDPAIGQYAEGASGLLEIVSIVLFILFVRNVCMFIERPDLVTRAIGLVVIIGVLFAIVLATVLLPLFMVPGGFGAGGRAMIQGIGAIVTVLGLAMIILGLVALVKYLNLLGDTKAAILGTK